MTDKGQRSLLHEVDVISSVYGEREDVSAIKSIEHIDGKTILQGSENGRGLTIAIS